VVVRSGPLGVGPVVEGHAVGRGEVEAEVREVVEVQVAVLFVSEDAPHDEEALLGVVGVAEADEAQRARAVEQLRDHSELGVVRLQLRVVAQELLALGVVEEGLHWHHAHVRLDASEAHAILRVKELRERRGEVHEAQNEVATAHLDEVFPVHDWCFQCMTAAVDLERNLACLHSNKIRISCLQAVRQFLGM